MRTLFDPGRPFYRSHALAAVTNIVLVESAESCAAATLAVHIIIGSSFEGDKSTALAYGARSVLVQ